MILLFTIGCDFDTDDLLDPPEPEFLDVSVDCTDDVLSVEALITSEYDVTNVTIERIDIDDADLDPLFPTLDVSAMSGGLTRWSLETDHDCEASILTTWTAFTVLESSASTEIAWPDVDLSGGPVAPPHGTDAGGSTVTITGTDMDAVTGVWFGETEGSILSATAESLTAQTPAGSPGLVDVTLAAGVTDTMVEDAFTYYPDATGMITGFSQTFLHVYDSTWFTIGSAYTTLDPYGPFVQLEVILQEPLLPEESYPMVYPEAGECSGGTYEWAPIDAGSYLTFGSDDLGSLAMLSNGNEPPTYYYVEADVDPALWSGQSMSLGLPEVTDQLPAMTVEDALLIPTLPSEPSFDWGVAAEVTWGEDITFTWTDTTAQRVNWTLYAGQGYSVLSSVSCTSDATTGELVVPWDTLTADVDPEDVTTVFARLGFIEDDLVRLPHDNSDFWSMGIINHWLYAEVIAP
ncbi:MAG: hypothetical protein ACI8RZ_002214 [Myxococcota bacterium]|jgi:hypothetical protein